MFVFSWCLVLFLALFSFKDSRAIFFKQLHIGGVGAVAGAGATDFAAAAVAAALDCCG